MINFLNLKYFVFLAHTLNFSQAAKKLFISQQALSNHISRLESYYGTILFDRNQPMTLTPAGKSLLIYAEKLLSLEKETERSLQDIKDFQSGEITIGMTSVRSSVMLPYLLSNYSAVFPQIKIHLYQGSTPQLEKALLDGKVDLTIGYLVKNTPNVKTELLLNDPYVLTVPRNIIATVGDGQETALLDKDGVIDIHKLAGTPFIKIPVTTKAGAIFEEYCTKKAFSPNIYLETDYLLTAITLCQTGLGSLVLPRSFFSLHYNNRNPKNFFEPSPKNVVIYDLHLNSDDSNIGINRLVNKYQTVAIKEFIKLTKALFKNQ